MKFDRFLAAMSIQRCAPASHHGHTEAGHQPKKPPPSALRLFIYAKFSAFTSPAEQ